jgi:DNA-binding MarR family transcriptional regulator
MTKKPAARPSAALLKLTDQQLKDLDTYVSALRESGIETLAEAGLFCAAASSQEMTLAQIVRLIGMPFSSASRVAYSLLERGVLTYTPHPTDRRKKFVRANLGA